MTENEGREQRIPVKDKRRVGREADPAPATADAPESSDASEASEVQGGASAEAQEAAATRGPGAPDLLADLQRLQAEFENSKKRWIRERTGLIDTAGARLIERMLPVLDDFDRAVEHSDDEGLALVYKAFRKVLEDEGLEEIEAAGAAFDPNVHEAVQVVEDAAVESEVVGEVYRRGYRLKGQVLRPAMVVVARPSDGGAGESEEDGHEEAAEG